MAMKSLRTIGICYKEISQQEFDTENKDERGLYSFEKNGFTLVCLFGIRDTIREEVPRSIAQCRRAGI
jgi:magnesium-transporting ATPase (P-type)